MVVRFPESISAPSASSEKAKADSRRADRDMFVSVALFSGIGLLISLVAILLGISGAWYCRDANKSDPRHQTAAVPLKPAGQLQFQQHGAYDRWRYTGEPDQIVDRHRARSEQVHDLRAIMRLR